MQVLAWPAKTDWNSTGLTGRDGSPHIPQLAVHGHRGGAIVTLQAGIAHGHGYSQNLSDHLLQHSQPPSALISQIAPHK